MRTCESLGTFSCKKEFKLFFEEILGSEGSAKSASKMAEHLENDNSMTWDNCDDDSVITDEIFIKCLEKLD